MAPVKRHALLLASIFVLHLFSEHEVVASRKSQEVGLFHHNFIRHSFHFLNVTEIDTFFVHQLIDCAFSCLRTVSCVSFNMAAYADANSTFLCELLASDKYNSSIEFLPHPHLHHHSIDVSSPSCLICYIHLYCPGIIHTLFHTVLMQCQTEAAEGCMPKVEDIQYCV